MARWLAGSAPGIAWSSHRRSNAIADSSASNSTFGPEVLSNGASARGPLVGDLRRAPACTTVRTAREAGGTGSRWRRRGSGRRRACFRQQRIPERRPRFAEVERQRHGAAVVEAEVQRRHPQRVADRRAIGHQRAQDAERVEFEPLAHQQPEMGAAGHADAVFEQAPEHLEREPVLGVVEHMHVESGVGDHARGIEAELREHRRDRHQRPDADVVVGDSWGFLPVHQRVPCNERPRSARATQPEAPPKSQPLAVHAHRPFCATPGLIWVKVGRARSGVCPEMHGQRKPDRIWSGIVYRARPWWMCMRMPRRTRVPGTGARKPHRNVQSR